MTPEQIEVYRRYVKMCQIEVSLAFDTSQHRFGMSHDHHTFWHMLKPFLNGKDCDLLKEQILGTLLPALYGHQEWENVYVELYTFANILPRDMNYYISTCTLCQQGV